MAHFGTKKLGYENYVRGLTTADWVTALDWKCRGFGLKTILVSSIDSTDLTQASYDFGFQILATALSTGYATYAYVYDLLPETRCRGGETQIITIPDPFARLMVQVRTLGGYEVAGYQTYPAGYMIEYIGLPGGS